jgi:hypothetical protein
MPLLDLLDPVPSLQVQAGKPVHFVLLVIAPAEEAWFQVTTENREADPLKYT